MSNFNVIWFFWFTWVCLYLIHTSLWFLLQNHHIRCWHPSSLECGKIYLSPNTSIFKSSNLLISVLPIHDNIGHTDQSAVKFVARCSGCCMKHDLCKRLSSLFLMASCKVLNAHYAAGDSCSFNRVLCFKTEGKVNIISRAYQNKAILQLQEKWWNDGGRSGHQGKIANKRFTFSHVYQLWSILDNTSIVLSHKLYIFFVGKISVLWRTWTSTPNPEPQIWYKKLLTLRFKLNKISVLSLFVFL